MKVAFSDLALPRSGALVVTTTAKRLTGLAAEVDGKTGGALKRAIAASRFEAKADQWVEVLGPKGIAVSRVLLCGLGEAKKLTPKACEKAGAGAVKRLARSGATRLTFAAELPDGVTDSGLDGAEMAARIALGGRLQAYEFTKYQTKRKPEEKATLAELTVATGAKAGARKAYGTLARIADGVVLTRDLVSEPANVIYPETLAARCRALTKLGLKVEVLGEARMAKLGMGALLGVGQGSARQSQLVVMRWQGAARSKKPLALVGKGVTFDTGGISLKPGAGMEDMKWDMGGAGAVIGAMAAIAGRKARANVVGVVGLVENMPSSTAQRPGDVVTSMSGQTIEVINTDAEGRLVLGDVLWYTKERFKPVAMVNLATLTGAIIVTFGHEYGGLFGNDDALANRLIEAGQAVDEKLWRLPLGPAYDKLIKSQIADMKNVGGRGAGSITAAHFLQRFVADVPWAHLDIAGMAWSKTDRPTVPKGGTGYGVRLLDELVRRGYEG